MGDATPSWLYRRVVEWRTALVAALVVVCALVLDLAVLRTERTGTDASVSAEAPPVATTAATTAPVTPTAAPEPTAAPATSAGLPEATVPAAAAPRAVPTAAGVSGTPSAPLPTTPAVATTAPPVVTPGAPAPTPATTAPLTAAPTPPAATPTTVATTVVTTIATTSPTTVATTPATTSPSTTVVQYLTYDVAGGVGTVVLASGGNAINLGAFSPNPGWVYDVEENGPRTVKLKFFEPATGTEREWTAKLESGQIKVEN